MSNETCQVNEGRGLCGRPAVGLLTQKTLESKGQPSKTINTYVCEEHAKRMEKTGGSHTVSRF
jgi:uncharacterized protein YlaI